MNLSKVAFKIKKAAEKAVLQGHPWVYETSIVKQNKEGETGDVAIIFDQRKNQFLALGLLDALSPIRIKVLHVGNSISFNESFIKNKLVKAFSLRKDLLKTNTTAYRLVYGENDGLPGLIIDIYNSNVVIKLYTGIWLKYLEWIQNSLIELIGAEAIVLRLNRQLQHQNIPFENSSVIYGKLESEEVTFLEHGLSFSANLIKGHKTGYFLDHRHNRYGIRKYANGKDVLDVFSYAGGFTVNAFAGGAKSVTSLDISEQALAIAKKNVFLNLPKAKHYTMAIDAFEGIKQLHNQKKQFELIIVDPPSFAKSEDQINKAKYMYRKLVKSVLPLVKSGGVLLMASCSSRIKKDEFYQLVESEVKAFTKRYHILEQTDHDVDHPLGIQELSYLKSIYFKIF